MQPMCDQSVSQVSAQMSAAAPVTEPAHASLTSSQMHCMAPGYPLQVGSFKQPIGSLLQAFAGFSQ